MDVTVKNGVTGEAVATAEECQLCIRGDMIYGAVLALLRLPREEVTKEAKQASHNEVMNILLTLILSSMINVAAGDGAGIIPTLCGVCQNNLMRHLYLSLQKRPPEERDRILRNLAMSFEIQRVPQH
jgi:hypothetical protein